MLPVQLKMGEAIVSLTKERVPTPDKQRRVKELQRLLIDVERRLAVERVAMTSRLKWRTRGNISRRRLLGAWPSCPGRVNSEADGLAESTGFQD